MCSLEATARTTVFDLMLTFVCVCVCGVCVRAYVCVNQDMAAIESMPLLGFEVTRMTSVSRKFLFFTFMHDDHSSSNCILS